MKHFNNIPIWENKRRLKLLKEFRGLVLTYFDNSRFSGQRNSRIEEDVAREAREHLNRKLNPVHTIVMLADASPVINWRAPAAAGGFTQDIDILLNMFMLTPYHPSHKEIIDHLDRAIGAYEADQTSSWVRTVNPFWWANKLLIWIAHLPFKFLGEIGFDVEKAEKAPLGKLVKGFFYLVPIISAFLTILNYMGWLEALKGFLN